MQHQNHIAKNDEIQIDLTKVPERVLSKEVFLKLYCICEVLTSMCTCDV